MSALTVIKKIHKWLTLLVGLQLLIWMISGLAFNLLSGDKISGRYLLKTQAPVSWIGQTEDFVEIKRRFDQIISISTTQLQQLSVYHVKTVNDEFILNPRDLTKIEISNLKAREIARASYQGQGDLTDVLLVKNSNIETRKFDLPVWQVNFADEEDSHLYISASTGKVLGIKTDSWRLFDFFWMLHIMDYSERSDMNNALVIFIALLTSLIGLSGLWLLFSVFSLKDFNILARRQHVPLLIQTEQGESTEIFVAKNSRLIDALATDGFQLPSNCGGGGSCGLCRVEVDPSLPVSQADNELLTQQQIESGQRLACQMSLTNGLQLTLPSQVVQQQLMSCRVLSNEFKTPLIKELVLELPQGANFLFNAGEYVLLHIPAGKTQLTQIQLDKKVEPYWHQMKIQDYSSLRTEAISRAYSMANPPIENDRIVLNVRLALPTDGTGESGKASSYLFSLNTGDQVSVSGPFGHFHASQENREMIFIGGGVGLAPLRSHILHQLESLHNSAKISLWFGARNENEIYYQADFDGLEQKFENFQWQVALSEHQKNSQWHGFTGMIHQVIGEHYLKDLSNIKTCDFYICGPPLMNKATREMLLELGVNNRNIHIDDFGS